MSGRSDQFPVVRVGTSGYSYAEWVDAGFYPPGTRSGSMLPAYARRFSISELNYTWYQMPKAASLERMLEKVAPEFQFAAKLTRTMTHEIDRHGWRSQVGQYREGIAPLVQAGQLVAVLIQLPPSFRRDTANRYYLASLLDALADLPLAVEFRHRSWAMDRVYQELQRRRVCLVSVDMPDLNELFPSLDVVTHPGLFYIRFHGRNSNGWRSGNMQKQFDYDYSDAELTEWVTDRIPRFLDQASSGVVFFNNHVRAQAPRNAEQFIQLLNTHGILDGEGRGKNNTS